MRAKKSSELGWNPFPRRLAVGQLLKYCLCVLLALPSLLGGEPSRMLRANLRCQYQESEEAPTRAPLSEDDLDAGSKAAGYCQSLYRGRHGRHQASRSLSGGAGRSHCSASCTTSASSASPSAPHAGRGEHAYRNGIGTPLRL